MFHYIEAKIPRAKFGPSEKARLHNSSNETFELDSSGITGGEREMYSQGERVINKSRSFITSA